MTQITDMSVNIDILLLRSSIYYYSIIEKYYSDMVTTKTFIALRSFVVIDNHLSKRPASDIREVHLVNRHDRNVRVFPSICKQHMDWTF